ncbi:hypothetical protein IWW36_001970 [Coemansia brasiliensis]|uniref:tRNA pseudouridine(55) synthase n=1 Tax=Coemansia brasiliensis TaxID=2650707 RepID=A0A9W8LYL7_9FUNG|nr:hypothetical protein IWW36_001970 [Coemansia brasiliensis]
MADTVVESAIANFLASPKTAYHSIEQLQKAAAALHKSNLCVFCVLRFLSFELGSIYQQQAGVAAKLEIPNARNSPCVACLGILNYDLADHVVSKYHEERFDAANVVIGIELPKSIAIRHRSMQLFCSSNDEIPTRLSDVVDIKDAMKYMISQRLFKECGIYAIGDSQMRIDLVVGHSESASEHQFLTGQQDKSDNINRKRRNANANSGDSRIAIINELAACSDEKFLANFASPPPAVLQGVQLETVSFKRASLFIGGRYLKLERNISQTPFIIGGRRVAELSVAEIIGEPVKVLTRCDSYNLVGSGREDADVRMLGDGRPFYLECINPRFTHLEQWQIHDIEHQLALNSSPVQTRRLQLIQPEDTKIIKEGEENKTKHYCALVWFAKQLSAEKLEEINQIGQKELVLQQKTPIRVLHRRAPLVRPKKILSLKVVHIQERFYKASIESEAGTYIKEFVHGDLGRTTPSLAEMAGETADILELDVESVSLDFPPP